MKKPLVWLAALLFIFGTAVTATAVPFVITHSDLNIDWKSGAPMTTAYDPVTDIQFELPEGDYFDFTLGTLKLTFDDNEFFQYAEGDVTLDVYFSSPDQIDVPNDGSVKAAQLFWFFEFGKITFGEPQEIPYGDGGLMELAINDAKDCTVCGPLSFDISGRVTNQKTPVSEPATTLLLGAGLVGLAGLQRKRFLKR